MRNLVDIVRSRMLTLRHDPESGCVECPFANDEAGAVCQATTRDLGGDAWEWARRVDGGLMPTPAPEWCPLRSGSVVVEGGS